MVLDYRTYFEFKPSMYETVVKDCTNADLTPSNFEELWDKWQNPENADHLFEAEQTLFKMNQTVQESLQEVAKRGENIESLKEKSENLVSEGNVIKKKVKKLNNSWWQNILGGCAAGPCSGKNKDD